MNKKKFVLIHINYLFRLNVCTVRQYCNKTQTTYKESNKEKESNTMYDNSSIQSKLTLLTCLNIIYARDMAQKCCFVHPLCKLTQTIH